MKCVLLLVVLVLVSCATPYKCKPWASLQYPEGLDTNDTAQIEKALNDGGIPPVVTGMRCKF